jgi:hypothetical protein
MTTEAPRMTRAQRQRATVDAIKRAQADAALNPEAYERLPTPAPERVHPLTQGMRVGRQHALGSVATSARLGIFFSLLD